MRNSRQIWEIGRIVSEGDLKFEIVSYIFADGADETSETRSIKAAK